MHIPKMMNAHSQDDEKKINKKTLTENLKNVTKNFQESDTVILKP